MAAEKTKMWDCECIDDLPFETRVRDGEFIERPADCPSEVPWSISCFQCDCDGPDSCIVAMLEGWTGIRLDLTGGGWNYLGHCPEHGEAS